MRFKVSGVHGGDSVFRCDCIPRGSRPILFDLISIDPSMIWAKLRCQVRVQVPLQLSRTSQGLRMRAGAANT